MSLCHLILCVISEYLGPNGSEFKFNGISTAPNVSITNKNSIIFFLIASYVIQI
jgi:hypothetical protein